MNLDRLRADALSLLRFVVGLTFSCHGFQKILGLFGGMDGHGGRAPNTLLMVAGLIELIGGLLILVGLMTRLNAFICSGQMAIAYFMGHFPRGFWPLKNGGEPAVLYCFIFLFLAAAGGGPWSLDALIRKKT